MSAKKRGRKPEKIVPIPSRKQKVAYELEESAVARPFISPHDDSTSPQTAARESDGGALGYEQKRGRSLASSKSRSAEDEHQRISSKEEHWSHDEKMKKIA